MFSFVATLGAAVFLAEGVSAERNWRGCQNPSVQQDFLLDAYLGQWYEIARDKSISFETGDCVNATYGTLDDTYISVRNN